MPDSRPQKRQACDRCHKSKLRCLRPNSDEGNLCARCLKKKAACVYSTPRPKGRPRVDTPRGGTVANVTDSTQSWTESAPAAPSTSPVLFQHEGPQTEPRGVDMGSQSSTAAVVWPLDKPDKVAQSLIGPLGLIPDPEDAAGGWFPDWELDTSWDSNTGGGVDNQAMPTYSWTTSDASVNPVSASSPGTATSTSGGQGAQQNASQEDSGISTQALGSSETAASYSCATEGCITPLSQLLALLTTALVKAQQHEFLDRGPLINHSAFGPVAALVASEDGQTSSSGHATAPCPLRDNLVASQHLLEILDHPHAVAPPDASLQSTRHSATAVRHLVLASRSLLINIYGILLTSLQQDADSVSTVRGSGSSSASSMVNMRLFLLVQLCSFSIDRLHEGVNRFMSSCRGDADASSASAQVGVNIDLEVEVQQKLSRLRQTLS